HRPTEVVGGEMVLVVCQSPEKRIELFPGQFAVAARVDTSEKAVEHIRLHDIRRTVRPVEVAGRDFPIAVAVECVKERLWPLELVTLDGTGPGIDAVAFRQPCP